MEPSFTYFNNLIFDDKKTFLIDFSDEDSLEAVVFKKNKDNYITSMACYVDLTVDSLSYQTTQKSNELLTLRA